MRRIAPEVEDAILADARATRGTDAGSVRQIAARHGVAHSTVRRIINDANDPRIDAPSARARTENATAAMRANLAERRARLAELLIERAERELADMDQPVTVYNFGGKDNTYNEKLIASPGSADRRNMMIIAATAIDKHKILDQYDSDAARGNAVDMWLAHMMGGGDADVARGTDAG